MSQIGIDIRALMSPVRAGVGEYTYELLNAIFKIDKANQYFLFYNSYKDVSANIPKWNQENVHYIRTKWPNKLYNASVKIFGIPKINKIKLDYFFSPNFNFTSLPANKRRVSMDATLHDFVKSKSILTIHDLSFEFFPQFFSFKQRLWHWAINPKRQCQKADTIITPSENTKRDIVDIYKINPEKIKVIYPGVNLHTTQTPVVIPNPIRTGEESLHSKLSFPQQRESRQFEPDTGFPLAAGMTTDRDPSSVRTSLGMTNTEEVRKKYNLPHKFILFLGTVEPRKNIIDLIEAFEQLCKTTLNYSLVIAGHKGWNDKEIYQKFNSSPVKDKIKLIGSVDAADKTTLYSMSELFVYPSFYEGFGFPVAEAMACGIPVITSNRSSLPEIAGNAAYLVNPNRPNELAQALIEMTKNEKLRERFKHLGLEQAKKFSWNKAAQEFIDLLQ